MKYVLLRDSHSAGTVFYTGQKIGYDKLPKVTPMLSKAYVYDYEDEDEMIKFMQSDWVLSEFMAVSIEDVNIFKAKLAGK